MKIKSSLDVRSMIIAILIVSPFFASEGWSQDKPAQSLLTTPVSLRYTYAQKPIKYLSTSKMVQTMDINGQPMDVNVNASFGCTIKSAGMEGKNIRLEIVVDTMGQSTDSPMGSSGGAVTDVNGKSFSVIITPNGKSVDFTEAENIVYNIEGSGESNLTSTFNDFFPVLPENPVKVGDTWNSSDTVKTTTKSMTGTTVINSVNKLDSLYMFDGVEWARIKSELTGTEAITIQNQGMDIKMTGPYQGTSEIIFAVKDGYFARQSVKTKMTGNIEISQPDVMTFPVVMNRTATNEMMNPPLR